MLCRFFRNEAGTLVLSLSLIMLPLAVLIGMLVIDVGRINRVRGQIQTAADAAALAGALTASPVPGAGSLEAIRDRDGNVTGVVEKVTGWRAVIAGPAAEEAARTTFCRKDNAGRFVNDEGKKRMVDLRVSPVRAEDDFKSGVIGDDRYRVQVRVGVKTFVAGPLMYIYGEGGDCSVRGINVTGVSQAVVR
jgi:uncharacterized membrane protein